MVAHDADAVLGDRVASMVTWSSVASGSDAQVVVVEADVQVRVINLSLMKDQMIRVIVAVEFGYGAPDLILLMAGALPRLDASGTSVLL